MAVHKAGTGGIRDNYRKSFLMQFTVFCVGFDDLIAQILGVLHFPFHKEATTAAGVLLIIMAELVQAVEHRDGTGYRISLEEVHLTWYV